MLLKRIVLLRSSNFSFILAGNVSTSRVKLTCGVAAVPTELRFAVDADEETALAGETPTVVEFDHEVADRHGTGFFQMSFRTATDRRVQVLDYWTSSYEPEGGPLFEANLVALASRLGIVHASPMQLLCFFSILAHAALPWRSDFSNGFGCEDGLWLFPGNLCYKLGWK